MRYLVVSITDHFAMDGDLEDTPSRAAIKAAKLLLQQKLYDAGFLTSKLSVRVTTKKPKK